MHPIRTQACVHTQYVSLMRFCASGWWQLAGNTLVLLFLWQRIPFSDVLVLRDISTDLGVIIWLLFDLPILLHTLASNYTVRPRRTWGDCVVDEALAIPKHDSGASPTHPSSHDSRNPSVLGRLQRLPRSRLGFR